MFDPRKLVFPELPDWSYAIDPLDSRYKKVAKVLGPYFGEPGLMGYRFSVEIAWVKRFIKTDFQAYDNDETMAKLDHIESMYGPEVFAMIKAHEKITNHDVKAVELTIDDLLREKGLGVLIPYVHIGCTSEDINNLAYSLMWKHALDEVILPKLRELMQSVAYFAALGKEIPMLARTHGQPATPTTMGKEYANFLSSLMDFYGQLTKIDITGKFNGATGNHAAVKVGDPKIKWRDVSKIFIEEDFGLKMRKMTAQIDPHEWMCQILLQIEMIALKLEKLCTDTWLYISYEDISQKKKEGEVGSSTMPHKINPIRFENGESHIKLLVYMIQGFVTGLMRSRMQRDLSDSALQRYCGIAFGLLYQAIDQVVSGMGRIEPNKTVMERELESNPQVLAEAIQTVFRFEGVENAYDVMKKLTQGNAVTLEGLRMFVADSDEISDENKKRLMDLTPATYIGDAVELTEECLAEYEKMFGKAA